MTLEEAKKIAKVISWADDGCANCVRSLVDEANEKFPEFHFEYINDYKLAVDDRVKVTVKGPTS